MFKKGLLHFPNGLGRYLMFLSVDRLDYLHTLCLPSKGSQVHFHKITFLGIYAIDRGGDYFIVRL